MTPGSSTSDDGNGILVRVKPPVDVAGMRLVTGRSLKE